MNQERVKRKLSAILSADVVGYSRLMGDDEVSTVRTLEAYRKVMSDLIEQFRGRVVDSPGDNLLSEFSSIVDAVQCAVEIHEVIRAKNEELPEDRRMLFRIGVNLGDVIEEGDRIYGDGVNIAARLEGLAEAGGICISGSAHEQIENKLALGYEYLGERTVKNITKPVKVYRVPMGPKAATPKEGAEKGTSSKHWQWTALGTAGAIIVIIVAVAIWNFYLRGPSIEQESIEPEQTSLVPDIREAPKTIAVLPFDDISPERDQQYFVDGIAEELLNSLTRISELEVRGRTSSFYFKDRKEDLPTISEMLNVEYILEGSVRKANEQVRITMQLVNTRKDAHIWSKTYEHTMDDIFAIQDDIAKSVADALQITLGVGELGRAPGMTSNIAAYDAYLAGRSLTLQGGRENISQAIERLEQALILDPDFAIGWNALASAYEGAVIWIPEKGEEFLAKIRTALSRVVELNPESDLALRIAASRSGDWVEEERLYQKALALNPANYDTNRGYGLFLDRVGRPTEAIDHFRRLVRMEPLASDPHLQLGFTYDLSGNGDAAVMAVKKAKDLSDQPAVPNGQLLLLAMEENNRSLIDEYLQLVQSSDFVGNINISDTRGIMEVMHALLDTPEEAGAELKLLLTDSTYNNPLTRVVIAEWASYFGEFELALQCCRESVGSNSEFIWTIWQPIHEGMRQLPEFKDFVRELGLVDYWRTSGKWSDFCRPVDEDDFECK
jgi:adenylate cyclase